LIQNFQVGGKKFDRIDIGLDQFLDWKGSTLIGSKPALRYAKFCTYGDRIRLKYIFILSSK
jgi:hypothetical protein